jgi:hypothetical protein
MRGAATLLQRISAAPLAVLSQTMTWDNTPDKHLFVPVQTDELTDGETRYDGCTE